MSWISKTLTSDVTHQLGVGVLVVSNRSTRSVSPVFGFKCSSSSNHKYTSHLHECVKCSVSRLLIDCMRLSILHLGLLNMARYMQYKQKD